MCWIRPWRFDVSSASLGRSSLRPGDHVPANGGYKHDKIIFLDVDGVLHSIFARNESQLFRRDCMQRLKKIVDQTGARIVLSSSWRKSAAGKNAVNQQLQRCLAPRAAGLASLVPLSRHVQGRGGASQQCAPRCRRAPQWWVLGLELHCCAHIMLAADACRWPPRYDEYPSALPRVL